MTNQTKSIPVEPQDIEVQIPSELRPGVYANTVNILANNSEIVLNFINVNPGDLPKGTLVSRVILPPVLADKLPELLRDVKKQLQEKKDK